MATTKKLLVLLSTTSLIIGTLLFYPRLNLFVVGVQTSDHSQSAIRKTKLQLSRSGWYLDDSNAVLAYIPGESDFSNKDVVALCENLPVSRVYIYCHEESISTAAMFAIKNMTSLKDLTLSGFTNERGVVEGVLESPSIEVLRLRDCSMTDADVSAIIDSSTLRLLDLRGVRYPSDAISSIRNGSPSLSLKHIRVDESHDSSILSDNN